MMRRIAFTIHLWTGLALFLPLVLIGLSGSVLVFKDEIKHALGMERYALAQGTPRPVEKIVAAAQKAMKPDFAPSMYHAPEKPGLPARVRFAPVAQKGDGGGRPRGPVVLVDPVSLAVLPKPEPDGFFRTMLELHANLLVEGRNGRVLVGAFGLALLALCISGAVVWWPRNGKWKAAFTVKRKAKGYRLHRDLHGATGIWGLAVLLVATFTGVYLSFPETTGAAIRAVFPGRDARAVANTRIIPLENASPASIAEIAKVAQRAVPEARIASVRAPSKPERPATASLRLPGETDGPAITVFIDPWRREVVEIHDPRSFTLGETLMAWQRPLHGGAGTGEWLWWRVLSFAAGVLPLLFAVTGIRMWQIKRNNRKASQRLEVEERGYSLASASAAQLPPRAL